VNEIELLRAQLATERSHAREVVSSCAAAARDAPPAPPGAAPAAWPQACTEYLRYVLESFDARDLRLDGLCERLPVGGAERRALAALGASGRGREALRRLTANGAERRWQELAQFIGGPWDARRAAVDTLLATNPRVADWRAFAGVDADSIRRERALYARCRATLPDGTPAPERRE
jgi:hypothetical protein